VSAQPLFTVIGNQLRDRQVDLSNDHALVVFVDQLPHHANDSMHLRLIRRVCRNDPAIRALAFAIIGVRRIVTEELVLDHVPHDVHAETVDASVQPEPHGIEHRLLDIGVAPVQVRLLFQESVVVVLARVLVVLPGSATKLAEPVVRRAAVRGRIPPQVPVPLRIVA
jgi:hypothetical protein